MSYDVPYSGLKVIDLSQGIAAPYCGMLLAQYGADVIKVEPIETGDWARSLGMVYGDHTAYSIVGNLGKRSIALDLKSPAGKEVLWRLVAGADVFLESFRSGVIGRLGFDYGAVAAREPRILYVSVTGFGSTGPLAERPAMDPVLQAYGGLMADNKGADGIPHRIPIIPVDMITALYAFQALSAALYARQGEPRGRHIETSLMQGVASLQVIRMMAMYLEGGVMRPGGAPGGVFKTADGWLNISIVREWEWVNFCKAIGKPELSADPRYASKDLRLSNEATLYGVLRPLIEGQPSEYWSTRLATERVMHERLNSYLEFLQQPHVEASGLISWLTQPGVGQRVPMPNIAGTAPLRDGTPAATAPRRSEHARAILAEHGFSAAEIAALIDQGVVGDSAPKQAVAAAAGS
ncbi:MAG TPA: CoA transferase [Candidatus Cybelea sp.]|nr:CoA transferase [Candidatus Cybelea sp.]